MRVVRLSILVPNYNRPTALGRLLADIYGSLEHCRAHDDVQVVVVDDFSEADISSALSPYIGYPNFTIRTQTRKCGNAEVAFLSALEHIETDYVWLVGNDDRIDKTAISCVLKLISSEPGFVLLNPALQNEDVPRFIPLNTTSDLILYEKGEDLFSDFGFVTSTTTFSCIVVETRPLRAFHQAHDLTKIGTVYSHTFSIVCAFQNARALFYSPPVVSFSLNPLDDEHDKLARQAGPSIMFFHQTLGLARLVRRASLLMGKPLSWFGNCQEDEVSKTHFDVQKGTLSHFIMRFWIEQRLSQLDERQTCRHAQIEDREAVEIRSLVQEFDNPSLSAVFRAVERTARGWAPWKRRRLAKMKRDLLKNALQNVRDATSTVREPTVVKITRSSIPRTPLRGTAADVAALGPQPDTD